MSRRAEQNKLTSGANGLQVEQNTIYDDNLLPAADELSKLKSIDPSIIPWVMKRTEVEQDGRISFNKKRLKLAGREITWAGISTMVGLVGVLMLIGFFFYLAYDLIKNGYAVWGGVFGTVDLVGLVSIITKFQMRKEK